MTDSPVGNGVHTEALFATFNVAKEQRLLARLQFRATGTWVQGTHSPGSISGFYGSHHPLVLSAPTTGPPRGASNAAPLPGVPPDPGETRP